MKFFFAITQSMIEKYGMPERMESKTYSWRLGSHTCYVFQDAGSVLNSIRQYGDKSEQHAICKAQLKNDFDWMRILTSALTGGTLSADQIDVIVDEITWVSNDKIKTELSQ